MKWDGFLIRIVAIAACFFTKGNVSAQLSGDDSSFYQSAVSSAIESYHHTAGDQSGIYNGMVYSGYSFLFKSGSPFFDSKGMDSGSVVYEGMLYKNLPLIYDNLKDVVVIRDGEDFIQLNNKRLSEFEIPGHHFIRLDEDDIKNSEAIAGFYEILYKGKVTVWKKTIKKIAEDISTDNLVEKSITQSDYFYIRKDSILYPVKNKRDIKGIFSDQKASILQFIKKNKLSFGEDKGNTLIQITAYYEQTRK